MEVMVKTELTDERISDLLCNAFEGGSNYWYTITKQINPNNKEVKFAHLELPLMEDCGLMIGDIEDEDLTPALLNREAIQKGLQIMADKYDWHFKNIIEENDDAETGDVLLQLSLFGEIVYG